ncbi:hypothetical protein K435DRAFT_32489 [Dendrothele bispora CBS 962.96]|uniref:Uncharacterized protein n=1 Tax=Dendrothele bispora (strain CBS 962.96) TaxID=1314807 RepID=A0A4S8M7L9_DENBC|nr:hypothetical protein K435DRAFT_32489 [Dendrothele bispora CBS 962.96]
MSPTAAAATPSNENDKEKRQNSTRPLPPSLNNQLYDPLSIDSVCSSHSHFFFRRLLSFSDGLKCITRRSRSKVHSGRFYCCLIRRFKV